MLKTRKTQLLGLLMCLIIAYGGSAIAFDTEARNSCAKKILNLCGNEFITEHPRGSLVSRLELLSDVGNAECKTVQQRGNNNDYVAILDRDAGSKNLMVVKQNGYKCTLYKSSQFGQAADGRDAIKVFEGNTLAANSKGRPFLVDNRGFIYRLQKRNGSEYSNVLGFKVHQDTGTIEFLGTNGWIFDNEELTVYDLQRRALSDSLPCVTDGGCK